MSERTCDTCVWWTWGKGRPVFEAGHRQCRHEKMQSRLYTEDSLAPQDLHELEAIATTGPKFGCIHHEEM